MKLASFNLLQSILTKVSVILKRDFNELNFLANNRNVDKFFNKTYERTFESLTKQLERINPGYGIMFFKAEEYTITKKSSTGIYWLIKPVDGEKNYKNRLPFFSIVINLVDSTNLKEIKADDVLLSAVYYVMKDELFLASKGEGAFLNGRKLKMQEISSELIAGNVNIANRNLGCDSLHIALLLANVFDAVILFNADHMIKLLAQLMIQEAKGLLKINQELLIASHMNNRYILDRKFEKRG